MSSGTLKELSKALTSVLSPTIPPYPLPNELQDTVQIFLDKHSNITDQDSQRLQDELLTLYNKWVAEDERKHATFLACLRLLSPGIRGTDRLLEWWNMLLRPTLESLGQHKGVVSDAREILLSLLVFEDDEDVNGEKARVSEMFTARLLDIYLEKTKMQASDEDTQTTEDHTASLIAHHLECVLVAFGKKRPKNLLIAIDALVVKKECRAQALSLLCTFVRHQPPHLYEVLKTPLLDHLLTCLMIDTSTTVISLALTTLVMFLPHVPSSLVPYLPRLFAVYARIICWEKYGQDRGVDEPANENSGVELSSSPPEESDVYTDPTWDKLHHSVDMADSTTPDLSHYFTFLYGLYPLNFMSFIRKPAKYLRDAKFSSGDEVKADQLAIHQRTEQFRQVHLLHPNFYTLTVDSELTDANRFLESEPADVVAECMALCAAVPLSLTDPGPPPSGKLPLIPKSQVATEDIPPQSLLASDDGATLTNGDDSPTESRLPASWRNTQSSMASADQSKLLRKSSQRSHGRPSSRPNGVSSRYSSPSSRVNDRNQDSPTLPAHLIQSSSDTNLKDMLQAQESLRTIIHEHTNDSNQSLSAPETSSPRLDAYIQSLSQNTPSRSPAARMKISGPQPKVAYLQREILLLKNDLNFERYLKQQHLSHIGQLQRKYIREATVEAETQKLINSNRALKIKQEEAKKMLATLRKETAASKNHAKKWEGELHQKARALREDQKTWRSEEDALRRELREARDECDHLRGLVLESEARELMSRQKLQQVELNMDELQSLRVEVEGLNARLREYESRQEEFDFGKQNEEIARTQLETLRIKLKARDSDREKMKRSYDQRIGELELRLQASQNPMSPQTPQAFQSMLDSALASSQVRFTQLKKLYNHLLNRYAELEMKYMESRAGDERGDPHGHTGRPQVYVGEEFDFFGQDDGTAEFSKRQLATSNPYGPHNAYKPGMHGVSLAEPFSASYPTHPAQLESLIGIEPGSSNNSPGVDRTTPFENSLSTFKSQQSDGSEYSGPPPSAANSAPGNPPAKIKASSEGRVYGRGGVQNIGKKAKPEKTKEKDQNKAKTPLKPGQALKGIRGFV